MFLWIYKVSETRRLETKTAEMSGWAYATLIEHVQIKRNNNNRHSGDAETRQRRCFEVTIWASGRCWGEHHIIKTWIATRTAYKDSDNTTGDPIVLENPTRPSPQNEISSS